MEIKYQSDFVAKDRRYSVGTVGIWDGYAMQINELRPRLAEGKLAPGEQCMYLFGISKEEHDLKDSDPKALEALEATLRREVPRDRLIATMVLDLLGKPVKKAVRPETGESIDNGAFIAKHRPAAGPIDGALINARKLQDVASKKDAPAATRAEWDTARAAAGKALLGLEKIFVPYESLIRGRYPYVREGRVEIFTTRERVDKAQARAKQINFSEPSWEVKEFTGNEINALLDLCLERGLNSFRVDAATLDVLLFAKDLRDREMPRNAALRGCILQELECGTHFELMKKEELQPENRNRLLERVLTMRNFTHRELGNAIVWAIGALKNKADGQLCTKNAFEKMDGGDGLTVVNEYMCILVGMKGDDKKYLALFTSEIRALAFAEKMSGEARPIAMTFDDVKALVEKIGPAAGAMIDLDDPGYRVPKEQFEQVLQLRNQPPRIVKIKAPETQAEPAAAPAAEDKATEAKSEPTPIVPVRTTAETLPDPDAYGLPDPDLAAAPKAEEETAASESAPETIETKPTENNKKEKGGFFRKLFGKK